MSVKITDHIGDWKNRKKSEVHTKRLAIAQQIKNRAEMLAPVDTGALKASGRIETSGDVTSVIFGSKDVKYARRRHYENYKNPQTLLYLERAGESVKKQTRFTGGIR